MWIMYVTFYLPHLSLGFWGELVRSPTVHSHIKWRKIKCQYVYIIWEGPVAETTVPTGTWKCPKTPKFARISSMAIVLLEKRLVKWLSTCVIIIYTILITAENMLMAGLRSEHSHRYLKNYFMRFWVFNQPFVKMGEICSRVPIDQGKFWKLFPVREIREKEGGFQPKSGKKISNQGTFFKTIFKPFNLRKNLFWKLFL